MPRHAHHMTRLCKLTVPLTTGFCSGSVTLWVVGQRVQKLERERWMAVFLIAFLFIAVELVLIVGLSKLFYAAVTRVLERAVSGKRLALVESSRRLRRRLRNALIVTCLVLSIVVLVFNLLL